MSLDVIKTDLKEILYLRKLYLQENNFQIRYNARHERNWSDSYFVMYNNEKIGYGSVTWQEDRDARDTVFEFYIIPPFRNLASAAFLKLLQTSKAIFIESQTNDVLTSSLLREFGQDVVSNVILFEDNVTTDIRIDNVIFRKRIESDVVFVHNAEPAGDYVLEWNNEIVASGGFLLHYNMPFADLYMEVRNDCRKKGFGSFLIQEIQKQCYLAGRVPAARTGVENIGSKATLLKAGLKIAGHMLLANVKSL